MMHVDVARLLQGVLNIDNNGKTSDETSSRPDLSEERARQYRQNRKGAVGEESTDLKLARLKTRLESNGYGPRVIAIGDVHGCVEELRSLLKVGHLC